MTATLFLRLLGVMTSLGFGYLVFDYNGLGSQAPHSVSGSIRVEGRPLSTGAVRFIPVAATQSVGAMSYVTNGEYAITEEDGLIPGKYQVCISGIGKQDEIRANREGGNARALLEEPIPARFNFQSQIFVEVVQDGNILGFDFDLK